VHSTSGKNRILVIIGPSASGKSSAVRLLADDGIVDIVPTWTTRPPRPEEANGIEHRFVSEKEFEQATAHGDLLEARQMFGLPYWYGLPVITPVPGKTSLIVLRAQLVPIFAKHYPAYVVYQISDSIGRVRQRLLARAAHGEAIGERLQQYTEEVNEGRSIAHRSFANTSTPESLAKDISSAIRVDFAEPTGAKTGLHFLERLLQYIL